MTIRIDDHLLWMPDAVGCGDTPTPEVLAAVSILRKHLPELKIRVINVVDLM
jgi:xylulose-5-phosphate/fructose-6-phosphate phosphoketolase